MRDQIDGDANGALPVAALGHAVQSNLLMCVLRASKKWQEVCVKGDSSTLLEWE